MSAYKLVFTQEAIVDVELATDYYDDILHGLGRRFKKEVKHKLNLLKQNPFICSIRYSSVRLAIIPRFPYSIHYSINDDKIIVHSVLCDYRNPAKYWVKDI